MDRRKSSFAVTCNRLGQYLKEKKSVGGVGGGGFGEVVGLEITPETPRTMNLLHSIDTVGGGMGSSPEESSSKSGQMTIFYGGRVIVIDNLSEEKLTSLMAIAGEPTITTTTTTATVNSTRPLAPSCSDLPIARRASLSLFLDKRKYRVSSKAPYYRS